MGTAIKIRAALVSGIIIIAITITIVTTNAAIFLNIVIAFKHMILKPSSAYNAVFLTENAPALSHCPAAPLPDNRLYILGKNCLMYH